MPVMIIPDQRRNGYRAFLSAVLLLSIFLSGCQPMVSEILEPTSIPATPIPAVSPTPVPDRPLYEPGQLVPYTAQTGDTLINLAGRFNTTVEEILAANPIIPPDATTMPPGFPMQIPIYYESLWGTAYQILPNSAYVNGPAQQDFDTSTYVNQMPGWLKNHLQYAAEETRSGAEIVEFIADRFSISPRILLALLEFQTQALTNPEPPADIDDYPLGYEEEGYHGLYIQLVWAANTLNKGYYGWQSSHLETIVFLDQTIQHPDPWQNSATVALHYYFSQLLEPEVFDFAVSPEGFIQTYLDLFNDPWEYPSHIPGSLRQPAMQLPFDQKKTWALTGGPHTAWGSGDPWAALDFAPPSAVGGCEPTPEYTVAVAPGLVATSKPGMVELDLDGDGDSRTGWVVFYLHLSSNGRVQEGTFLQPGDPVGHPSCEGGESTGSHVHIARKYNGEWIPASGVIPFNLDNWIPEAGDTEYAGGMTRFTEVVIASMDAEEKSLISSLDIVK